MKQDRRLYFIFTYINTAPNTIDFMDFIMWVLENGYYKVLFNNWSIIRDLIIFHNQNIKGVEARIEDFK